MIVYSLLTLILNFFSMPQLLSMDYHDFKHYSSEIKYSNISFSEDGSVFAYGREGSKYLFVEVEEKGKYSSKMVDIGCYEKMSVAVINSGVVFAVSRSDGSIDIFDPLYTFDCMFVRPKFTIPSVNKEIKGLALSANGKKIAICRCVNNYLNPYFMKLSIFDLETNDQIKFKKIYSSHLSPCSIANFSFINDGKELLLALDRGEFYCWDINSRLINRSINFECFVREAACNSEGVVAIVTEKKVYLWNTITDELEEYALFNNQNYSFRALCWDVTGNMVLVGLQAGTMVIIDVQSKKYVSTVCGLCDKIALNPKNILMIKGDDVKFMRITKHLFSNQENVQEPEVSKNEEVSEI